MHLWRQVLVEVEVDGYLLNFYLHYLIISSLNGSSSLRFNEKSIHESVVVESCSNQTISGKISVSVPITGNLQLAFGQSRQFWM